MKLDCLNYPTDTKEETNRKKEDWTPHSLSNSILGMTNIANQVEDALNTAYNRNNAGSQCNQKITLANCTADKATTDAKTQNDVIRSMCRDKCNFCKKSLNLNY